ncbi:Calcium-dependent protein kinase [Thalictrum thalictroides]|uniref:non-specific serine/threonine protein kinase n=1 Tax=Thalictrum thalictroides TaxID=46969 RepID=A0A7J6WTZ9_THATH|nr:Calcium-dependent protein kinase [Thalictrum thalictroides]
MGNTCVGPYVNSGFLAAIWGTREVGGQLPPPNGDGSSNANPGEHIVSSNAKVGEEGNENPKDATSARDATTNTASSKAPMPVQSTPPQPVTISQTLTTNTASSKAPEAPMPVQSTPPQPVKIGTRIAKPQPRVRFNLEDEPETPPPPVKISAEEAKPPPRAKFNGEEEPGTTPPPVTISAEEAKPPPRVKFNVEEEPETPPPPLVKINAEEAKPPPQVKFNVEKEPGTPPPPVKISAKDAKSPPRVKFNVEEEPETPPPPVKISAEETKPPPQVKFNVEEEPGTPPPPVKISAEEAKPPPQVKFNVEEEPETPPPPVKISAEVANPPPRVKFNVEEEPETPPPPIQISAEEAKPPPRVKFNAEEEPETPPVKVNVEESKPLPPPVKITVEESKAPPPPVKIKVEESKQVDATKPVDSTKQVKPDVKEERSKQSEPAKAKKPPNIKRVQSVGLQTDSVLQRKTENMKETYSLGRKLGQGQYGTTFYCLEKATGKEFACKSIGKRKLTTQEDVEDVRREIQIMHHLAGHPNVISITGAYEDAVAVYVVMEFCAGGELFDRIIQRGHYTEKKAAELARVIVGVVEACHSLGVMHRDLKPENFLFVNKKEEAPLITIDFGLSVFFKPGETFTDVVGSPYYVAPEVLLKNYGQECDVWSAGIIIYILLSGVPPFWDETEQGIFEQVLKGQLNFESDPWPSISDSAKDLMRKMLVKDPKKRLTAHEVLCHPWVRVDGVAPDKPLDSAILSRLNQFSAMNKLKKLAIRVIAESLSEEEIAGLKEMFKMIDTDNSGHITLEELKAGLERVGANLNQSEITELMQAADIDNSGTIDYGEFLAATLHLNKVEKEDHLFSAFSYLDKDGSGYITQDELQQACKQFGIDDNRLEEMIHEVDHNNDGRIDYSEFVDMMKDGPFVKKGLEDNNSGLKDALTPG